MNAPVILIVEDDDLQYEIYEESLSKYELVRAKNGTEALAKIPDKRPNVLILDHILAEGELGLEFLLDYLGVVKQFRSEGRFAWIFYYVFSVFSVYNK